MDAVAVRVRFANALPTRAGISLLANEDAESGVGRAARLRAAAVAEAEG